MNIQCLRNKLEEIDAYIADKNIKIIVFTEHWLSPGEIYTLNTFTIGDCYYRQQYKHGGALIMVQEGELFNRLEFLTDLSVEKTCEMSGIVLNKYDTIIISIYRSPNGVFHDFINILATALERINIGSRYVYVCGDFNVHFNKEDRRASELSNLFACYGLNKLTNLATRGTVCLDNIFSNAFRSDQCNNVQIIDIGISDHRGIITELNICPKPIKRLVRPITFLGKYQLFNFIQLGCFIK